jgi:hypothetical protein
MAQRRIGTEGSGPVTWRERALAVVATVLAGGLAVGAAAVGLVVGLVTLAILVPLALIGVLWLRRLMRRAVAGAPAPGPGRGEVIEGEYEVVDGAPAGPDSGAGAAPRPDPGRGRGH